MLNFDCNVDGNDVDISFVIAGQRLYFTHSFEDAATAHVVKDRIHSEMRERIQKMKAHAMAHGKRVAKGRAKPCVHFNGCINSLDVGSTATGVTVKGLNR